MRSAKSSITALLLLAAPAAAQGLRSNLLVSTAWLAAHLGDPQVLVLHVTRDARTYQAGHIPGAGLLSWDQLTVARDGLPVELPPLEELVERLENAGVSDEKRVVLYGDNLGLAAARAWFTLDYLGHGHHAALLDGGLEKWRAESRPVSQETPPPHRGRLTVGLRPQVLVDMAAMRALIQKPGARALLLDARPPAEYRGEKPSGNPPRAGHIPGARNLYWMEALVSPANPVLRPASELRRMFEAVGARPGRRVITYCVAGVQAAYVYFLARYLGYDAALYDGSLAEWNRAGGELATEVR